MEHSGEAPQAEPQSLSNGSSTGAAASVRDPVCGMQVVPTKAAAEERYLGKTYWFCSTGCKNKFTAEPAKYLLVGSAAKSRPAAMASSLLPILSHPPHSDPPRVTDPVCGMKVDPAQAAATAEFEGKSYFFCHSACLVKFQANPRRFTGGDKLDSEVAAPATPRKTAKYTCPMHPEIVKEQPGS